MVQVRAASADDSADLDSSAMARVRSASAAAEGTSSEVPYDHSSAHTEIADAAAASPSDASWVGRYGGRLGKPVED